jgi:hypothetical protein
MKAFVVLAFAAFLISVPAACKSSPESTTVTQTHADVCPACKDKVTWVYGQWPGGPKGIPTGKKVVTHDCAGCKQAWSSAVAEHSACSNCLQQAAMCPACQAQKK